jgi:predicted kinase
LCGGTVLIVLLVLNGAPAVGKSTLAQRYADEHPLSLVIDIDMIRSHLGRLESLDESKLVARDLAVARARAHLLSGHDVIVAQYLGRPEFLERRSPRKCAPARDAAAFDKRSLPRQEGHFADAATSAHLSM